MYVPFGSWLRNAQCCFVFLFIQVSLPEAGFLTFGAGYLDFASLLSLVENGKEHTLPWTFIRVRCSMEIHKSCSLFKTQPGRCWTVIERCSSVDQAAIWYSCWWVLLVSSTPRVWKERIADAMVEAKPAQCRSLPRPCPEFQQHLGFNWEPWSCLSTRAPTGVWSVWIRLGWWW